MAFVIYDAMDVKPAVCGGLGDCVKYTAMTNAFASGDYLKIDYPFNLRILAPLIASSLPYDVENSFLIINTVSAIFFIFFLFKISQALSLGNLSYIFIAAWFFVHPSGFSFYHSVPISVDPLAYALMSMVIFYYVQIKPIYLAIALFFGLLAKESFSFIAIIILISIFISFLIEAKRVGGEKGIRLNQRPAIIKCAFGLLLSPIFAMILYGFIKKIYILNIFPQSQDWKISSLVTISWWVAETMKDPLRLIVWIGSFFVATGVFSSLLFTKSIFKFSSSQNIGNIHILPFLTLGAIGFISFGILAGSDMTRIIFNGNLFILLFIFFNYNRGENSRIYLAWVALISFSIALGYVRIFPSAFEYGYYASRSIENTAWFVVVVIMVTFWLSKFSKRFFKGA